MDLNIDFKNLKIEDIKEKLLKLADKKTLIKIGIGAGAVIIFLIIYYAVLNPIVKKKKIQLDDMNKKKQETTELIQKIKSKQKKINKLKPRYEQYSTLFHSKAEVEGLYNTLSVFAGENDLVISKIEKKEIKQVTKAAALESVSKKKKKKKKRKKKGDKIKKW
jgi:ABC-type anion transport system duplicated permease subunit